MSQLEDIVAVVTGGTKGIGLAVCEALIGRGASVVVSSRTPADVDAVTRDLNATGPGEAHGIPCDVREPEQCTALVNDTLERFGRLDVLVNNAGLGRFASIQEMAPEDWELQIRTNLDGVFHCSKAAVPHLIEAENAWIINIASLASRNTFAGGVGYNASKWGLLGMSEAMMLDLRHEGVRVTCVMPGTVNTHFFGGPPDAAESWKLQPEDVAQAVLDILDFPPRALPSRIELRPTKPR